MHKRFFHNAIRDVDVHVPPMITRASADGRKQYLEAEKDYNVRYALEGRCILLDRVMFSVPDVRRSDIELCDLLDIRRKRLIHVKMRGRKSSVLSHLFKQGANSATLLKSVEGLWETVVERVRENHRAEAAEELRVAIIDNSSPWTVEFHIVDAPVACERYTMPFFSRVSFREERTRMQTMGFDVAVRCIPKPVVRFQP